MDRFGSPLRRDPLNDPDWIWELKYDHGALEDTDLVGYAAALGLDLARFIRELGGHIHAARMREDYLSGVSSGVLGTPTFFINGLRHDGSYEHDELLAAIGKAAR